MYTAQGTINRDALLEEHLPAVRRQALSLQVKLPSGIDLDDLIQAGTIGLLDAMQRFDPNAGASFSTFANQRIRGAMIDELRTRDWLPRSVRRNARLLEQSLRQLEQRLGRAAEEREIAAEMGVSLDEYHRLLLDTNSGHLLPFEEIVAESGEPEAGAGAPATPFSALVDHEQREQLVTAIEQLPEREKLLMALYYQEELNLKEIGVVLGVTESRVCQLHSQAIKRLRTRLV
ncbi:RNA polymerase sigma factor FliA [Microbulbifer celer]|uniref:RNA polymerase sigma factor FliA n=1 Tax=Microbulbifer celer TaxID=435905 RepID=A0ABW3U508_9GAMM|nr:RNA polymerase sigma factor FliA [Microbulbifer celer]UFN57814.1 RNA polymerase sigma factor FliA [Microbulbifer celer]